MALQSTYAVLTAVQCIAMEQEYDVIVVGAGVVGSSTAYHLVKNGVKRVLLLEQVSEVKYLLSKL